MTNTTLVKNPVRNMDLEEGRDLLLWAAYNARRSSICIRNNTPATLRERRRAPMAAAVNLETL
jgi:hypothetical protein